MGINNPSSIEMTNSESPATTSTGKKRNARAKTSGVSTSRTMAKRTPAASAVEEILFKDLPNPYKPANPPYIWIDHPQQNERLHGSVYVIRLGVGGADAVELSIDKGAWQKCRLTSGYWWYDWAAISKGKHVLTARMRTPSGLWYKTPPRTVEY